MAAGEGIGAILYGMVLRVVMGFLCVVYMMIPLTILLDWARMTSCYPRICEISAYCTSTTLSPFSYSYLACTRTLGPLPLRPLPTP